MGLSNAAWKVSEPSLAREPAVVTTWAQSMQRLSDFKPLEIRMLLWSLCCRHELTEAWKLFDVLDGASWPEPEHGGPCWRALLAQCEQRGLSDAEDQVLNVLRNDGMS